MSQDKKAADKKADKAQNKSADKKADKTETSGLRKFDKFKKGTK